jgi:hypothetical protein
LKNSVSNSTTAGGVSSASRNKFSMLRLNGELGYVHAKRGSCTPCVS